MSGERRPSTRGVERDWGQWTVIKLDALSRYLSAFTTACSGARRTMYLDLFAGSVGNRSRETGEPISGSAARALDTSPRFSKLLLSEWHPGKAATLSEYVAAHHRDRDVEVLPGDCNVVIPQGLASLALEDPGWRLTPAFAFVDQLSADIRWETLKYLSEYRTGKWKTELWMYFGDSFIVRGLSTPGYAERVDAMYGNTMWREIDRGFRDDLLTPAQRKAELANLMRWQLQHDLGYATTIALDVARPDGHGLYSMVFATDHDVGEKIMGHVLHGAEEELQAMVERTNVRRRISKSTTARGGAAGFEGLDEELVASASRSGKTYLILDPPIPPWTYPREGH
jgi:three-Cys-motif partner protein